MERAKNLLLVSAGYIAGENLLEFFRSIYLGSIFSSSLLFFRFILCILQMAFALFHIFYFMMQSPPKYNSRQTMIMAAVICGFTFVICIWNLVFMAEYLNYPGYEMLIEISMMAFISLEAYLFFSYVKKEEELEDGPSDGSSDGSAPSPVMSRNPNPPASNPA